MIPLYTYHPAIRYVYNYSISLTIYIQNMFINIGDIIEITYRDSDWLSRLTRHEVQLGHAPVRIKDRRLAHTALKILH